MWEASFVVRQPTNVIVHHEPNATILQGFGLTKFHASTPPQHKHSLAFVHFSITWTRHRK
jgi:hypothetical protein